MTTAKLRELLAKANEKYVPETPNGLGGYWSPHAAMVDSAAIHELRQALGEDK